MNAQGLWLTKQPSMSTIAWMYYTLIQLASRAQILIILQIRAKKGQNSRELDDKRGQIRSEGKGDFGGKANEFIRLVWIQRAHIIHPNKLLIMPPKAKSQAKKPLKKDAKNAKAASKKVATPVKAADSKSKSVPKTPVSPPPAKSGKGKSVAAKPASPAKATAKSTDKSPAKATVAVVIPVGDKRKASSPAPTPTKVDAKLQKVVLKGGAAVDKFVPNHADYRVHQDSNRVYSATLNQSNLDANNNKFYIIQVLLNQKTNQYVCFNRWGRVGVPGQQAMRGPYSAQAGISDFNSKLRDKTAKGEYIEIEIKFDADDDEADKKKDTKKDVKPKTGTSKMDARLQKFINLIFDTQVLNNTMKEIGYDPSKMPLGKLGDSTIKEAYSVLSELATAIKKKDHDAQKSLSGKFYSLIPHNFGFKKMIDFILDTEEKVKGKLQMLADISDMKITTKLLASNDADEDIVDQNYKKLGCTIEALDKKAKDFTLISEYLHNTKESWKIEIDEVYKINRPTEEKSYNGKLKNKMLLWHGSRIANFVGILSQGLRIAPPEAPVSGYLFGKGIYLADMIDKSAGYCRSWGSNTALCLLIEGALGDPNILTTTNSGAKELMEKAKKNSTKCHGSKAPPEKSYVKIDGDVIVPAGKATPTGSGSYMGHNEYIVYDMSQAKIRYVVKMNMN